MNSSLRLNRVLLAALLLLFAVIVLLIWWFPPSRWIDNETVGQWVDQWGISAIPLFFAIGAVFTAFGLPRQLVAFTAGYVWGVSAGVLISTLSAIAGCYLTFTVSRKLLSGLVTKKFPKLVALLNRVIEKDAFLKIVILRLQPFGTNLATNLSAGVTRIPARVFLPSSFLGYVPQMLVFALTGAGIRVGSSTQLILSAGLFVISLLIAVYLYRKGTLYR